MEHKNTHSTEDEIDLLALFKTIWQGKKTIIRFVMIFGFIGLFIAIFSAKEYTASAIIIPQENNNKSGGLGSLAAMAGINIGGANVEVIPSSLYPKIVESILFKRELVNTPLRFPGVDKEITYKEYYEFHQPFNLLSLIKEYTLGLPTKILNIFKKDDEVDNDSKPVLTSIFRLNKEEKFLFKQLDNQFSVSKDRKEGFITISFSMPEPLPAAQMTERMKVVLQKMITDFKIQKAKDKLVFINERFLVLKSKLEEAQNKLAIYRDSNRGIATSKSKTNLQMLEANYNLAYGIYSEVAKQLESQKIQVKEDTPTFTVIQPVTIPVKSNTSKKKTLILFVFIGGFFGVVYVLLKKEVIALLNKIKTA